MKKLTVFLAMVFSFVFCLSCLVSISYAQSKEDAVKMVNDAINYIKTNGKEKAYKDITDGKVLKKGDLYVFALTSDYYIVAHGANPKLLGKPMEKLKDSNGKFFFKEMVDKALKNGEGWTDYTWTNPVTKKIEPKTTYTKKLDDKTIVGCGIYKK